MARRIWIDTDPGFDDLAAIVLAAAWPELQMEGVGVVAGNAPLERVLDNTLRLADLIGLATPIYAGCDRPLVRSRETAENVLGAGALGTSGQSLPQTARQPAAGHAVLKLIEAAKQNPGELTLVAIGPLTNVALAMRLEPTLPRLLREIVLMGGSTDRGNHTAAAEFNIYADPEAAAVVFGSGAHITMFGLNLTRQVPLRWRHVELVRGSGSPNAQLWADLMDYYLRIRDRSGQGSMPLHDPVTVAYLIKPELFTLQLAHVSVETSGTYALGATVCEFRIPGRAEPNAQVAIQANGERVMELVVEAFARL